MSSAMRYSSKSGAHDDVFAKVKGLISDMIDKLQQEAEEDASQKAYCDKELGETTQRHEEMNVEIEELSTKIDQANSRSAKLKEEVAGLQKALAELASSQAEADKLRQEERAIFETEEAELKKGLKGIKLALKVLQDYYAQDHKTASSGAGSGIIGLLEVCESDFSKGLAEITTAEEQAQASYDQELQQNKMEQASKGQDVKYKNKEAAGLEKSVSEMTNDRSGTQTELDAVNQYLAKLKDQCLAKAEPYAERKKRREAEIAGLKEALEILEGEGASLLQRSVTRRATLRGVRPHAL